MSRDEPRIKELEQQQNQKAIKCLREVKKQLCDYYTPVVEDVLKIIDNKIKELEGE